MVKRQWLLSASSLLLVCVLLLLGSAPLSRAEPPAAEPSFEVVHAAKWPKRRFGYRGMPGDIELLKDGRLLLAYTSDDPEGRILARHSDDQGKTWGPKFTLLEKPVDGEKANYAHPSFLRLPSGQILMSYIYISGSMPRYGQSYYRRSNDEGRTWGEQFVMTPYPGYHLVHNDKLVQLSSGRIIAPVEHELAEEGGDHRGFVSYVFYSDDNALSWRMSKNMINVLPVESQEPHVVELNDGRLMMLCRTYSGYVVRSYSSDQGVTWSEGEHLRDLKLPPNSSALNVKRIPSTGDLLLLRCAGGVDRRRTPFVSAISRDDGSTWTDERVIMGDPNDDYGYPSLLFLDGTAVISFHKRDGLHVARIPIDWFYGK